ncbi:hypothetical protein [Desulfobacter latus]|uniref:Uncharacterized protein n=1 Tax=Desulfobacter latus TaxID=2292 RepID=A0A850SV63_9BACT|nr:hypothetical protein [Desulfobacter latus]NWH05254.1 hypothetical protein [Desulfobacter latus]
MGIDPGWDYNVGRASALGRVGTLFMDKLTSMPARIDASMAADFPELALDAIAEDVRSWMNNVKAGKLSKAGGNRVVGAMSLITVEKLNAIGVMPETAAITLKQRSIKHLIAEERKGDKALPEELVSEIAALLQDPKAVV